MKLTGQQVIRMLKNNSGDKDKHGKKNVESSSD